MNNLSKPVVDFRSDAIIVNGCCRWSYLFQWRSQKFSKGGAKLFDLNLHFETKVSSSA